jgi:hypothetical protein
VEKQVLYHNKIQRKRILSYDNENPESRKSGPRAMRSSEGAVAVRGKCESSSSAQNSAEDWDEKANRDKSQC